MAVLSEGKLPSEFLEAFVIMLNGNLSQGLKQIARGAKKIDTTDCEE